MQKTARTTQDMKRAADIDDARVEASKKNLLLPLALLSNDFRERIRKGLKIRKHQLHPGQSSVIVHLRIGGSRPSELAEKAGMTKQAMGKIVDELQEIGYVEKAADPNDGRAKIIRFTEKGLDLLQDSGDIIDEIWRDYTELVGAKRLGILREELDGLLLKVMDQRSRRT